MRKTDPTPKPQLARLESWRLNGGNRKPPPISLPRIRALETPEPKEEKDGLPSETVGAEGEATKRH